MKRSILAVLAAFSLCAHAAPFKGGVFDPPRAAPQVGLAATDGKVFRMADHKGKVVVLEFGYTHCQDVCPVSLAALVQARQQLGKDAARLQVVFVSVDPARDTLPRLKAYLKQFDPGFIGITGTQAQVDKVLKEYGISVTKRPLAGGPDYLMGHSSYLYFVDPDGMLRSMLPFGRPAAEIVHDVKLLIKP
jgi:protein SCO1/2